MPWLERTGAPGPELAGNPRYLLRSLHSIAIPGARAIGIYLPSAYLTEPDRRFPVFYLHDGQNVFDGSTSYLPGRTWRAHTTADRLTEAGSIEPIILVGIANAGLGRMAEYTPTRDPKLGGGEGFRYGRLLVDELKPLIDAEFRTQPGPQTTGLGGSSLGGLISLYLALDYRNVFGRAAVLSPSVWWDQRSILRRIRSASPEPELRIWLDMGMAEGVRHLRDTDLLYSLLIDQGWEVGMDLEYARVPGAVHDEDAWAERFGDVLSFLFPAARPSMALPTEQLLRHESPQ